MKTQMHFHKVLATHEEPQEIAFGDGKWPGDHFPGVALPSRKALGKWVVVVFKDRQAMARVVDVGPWCIDDDQYVFGGNPPRAEVLRGKACPRKLGVEGTATIPDGKGGWKPAPISNGAGIDLFPSIAKQLGIPLNDNVMVAWSFCESPRIPSV